MSEQYNLYLLNHARNVQKGFWWFMIHCPDIFQELGVDLEGLVSLIDSHDLSKKGLEEYNAYDEYFYGTGQKTYEEIDKDFNLAWLHHIHNNPHHWQHWVLINDDPDKGEIILDMPGEYIFEMICDWWSFSWAKRNPTTIFDWYDEHKDYMKLSEDTRNRVEYILKKMKEVLDGNG